MHSRITKRLVPLVPLLFSLSLSCDRDDLNSGPTIVREPEVDPEELPGPQDVRINEFMLINTQTLEDESGDFPPWVEFFNPTDFDIDLSGVAFSDSFLQSTKWSFPESPISVVPSLGFLIVFTDGDTDNPDDLHASFTLSQTANFQLILNGGSDILTGNTSNSVADISMGRFPDGEGTAAVFLKTPTPGEFNAEPDGPELPTEGEFIRGDVDENNTVNVVDSVLLTQIANGSEPFPPCQDRADANDDGMIDESDGRFLLQALFDPDVTLPPPFPEPGTDPTPDELSCPALQPATGTE